KAACRLLSKKAMKEGEYHSFAQCARIHSHLRALGHVPIVEVDVRSKTDVDVVVYKRGVPDSGGDLPLHKYGSRWLIHSGQRQRLATAQAPDVQGDHRLAVGANGSAVRDASRDDRELAGRERGRLAVDDEVDRAALGDERDLILRVLVGLPRAAGLVAVDGDR